MDNIITQSEFIAIIQYFTDHGKLHSNDNSCYLVIKKDRKFLVFKDTVFERIDITDLRIRNVKFINCEFKQCYIENTTFDCSYFLGCHFRYCKLTNVSWCNGCTIDNTKFALTKIEDFIITKSCFTNNCFYLTSMTSMGNYSDFIECKFKDIHAENSVFSLSLKDTKLVNSYFEESSVYLVSKKNIIKGCSFYTSSLGFHDSLDTDTTIKDCIIKKCYGEGEENDS